ncbi:MAG: LysM peptidoglycan-binding domain-containing protein [Gammaproteobacteria bacterium]
MSRKISVFLASLLCCYFVVADEVEIRGDNPGTYTVIKGDTLWDIAGRFLTRPWQWTEIWESNPQIENPHLIYPGDVIALKYVDGKPTLSVVDASDAGDSGTVQVVPSQGRLVKLSPTIRESRHEPAVTAIPLDAIQQFLSRPQVVDEEELSDSAYVVGSQDEHLTFGSGHRVYVRGLDDQSSGKFGIYRQGEAYVDPDSEEVLGYEAEHVGDAIVERFGDPATVLIVRASKEILKGDRLIPQAEDRIPEFIPRAPAGAIDGKIISLMNGVNQISQHQVVVLNRGDSDGLQAGHVLAIYQDGEVIEDVIGSDVAHIEAQEARLRDETENPSALGRMFASIGNELRAVDYALRDFVGTPVTGSSAVKVQLPDERAGELMVFRTFPRVSYALVMNTQRNVNLNDQVRNP